MFDDQRCCTRFGVNHDLTPNFTIPFLLSITNSQHKELLTSIRRYYSNAFTDRLKQDAMNLVLGYYVPYRHTIPLWEMETDYWLHNHPRNLYAPVVNPMQTYQRIFGVESDQNFSRNEDSNSELVLPTEPTHSALSTQRAIAQIKSRRLIHRKSLDNFDRLLPVDPVEARRVSRVRTSIKAQNDVLSVWWRVALQRNIQQRMWMQVGETPEDWMLPPRFERLYEPEKLEQFDRFFLHGWRTPVRGSHSAQHSAEPDEHSAWKYKKSVSGPPNAKEAGQQADDADGTLPLDAFIRKYGYSSRYDPSLRHLTGGQYRVKDPRYAAEAKWNEGGDDNSGTKPSRVFVGSIDQGQDVYQEFIDYTSEGTMGPSATYRKEAVGEFTRCLHDTSLHSDDVEGIQKVRCRLCRYEAAST